MYLPFYLTFASQANGLSTQPGFLHPRDPFVDHVRDASTARDHLDGLDWRAHGSSTALKRGGLFAISIIVGLWVVSILVGLLQLISDPSLSGIWGAVNAQGLILASIIKQRLRAPGAWLTLLYAGYSGVGNAPYLRCRDKDFPAHCRAIEAFRRQVIRFADPFVLLIFLVGAALVVFPEFFYLRDQFGYRMNTIFKFYFQGWILWGIVAGYASAVLLRELRGSWRYGFS